MFSFLFSSLLVCWLIGNSITRILNVDYAPNGVRYCVVARDAEVLPVRSSLGATKEGHPAPDMDGVPAQEVRYLPKLKT